MKSEIMYCGATNILMIGNVTDDDGGIIDTGVRKFDLISGKSLRVYGDGD